MPERPIEPTPEEEQDEALYAASMTEMTGLIPSGRPDRDERDSYQDVLPWLPPHAGPAPAI